MTTGSSEAATVQLWIADRERLPARCAMRQLMPTTRDSALVLLVQPRDDGLQMYAEFLCHHGLAVIAVTCLGCAGRRTQS